MQNVERLVDLAVWKKEPWLVELPKLSYAQEVKAVSVRPLFCPVFPEALSASAVSASQPSVSFLQVPFYTSTHVGS